MRIRNIEKSIYLSKEENKGSYSGTMKSINYKHKELYGNTYSNSEQKLRNNIIKIKKMLLNYDGIEYIPAGKNPTAKGRLHTFNKVVNLVVDV